MKKNLNQELKDAFAALDAERVKALLAAGADKSRRIRNRLLLQSCGKTKPTEPVKPEPWKDHPVTEYQQKRYMKQLQKYPEEVKAYNDHIQYMTLLLENGANPNAKDPNGDYCSYGTALCSSLVDGYNLEEAELLVKYGAKPAQDDAIWIAEHRIDCEGLPLIKFLYDHGANINAKDYMGDTALMKVAGFEAISAPDLFSESTKWLIEPIEYFVSRGANLNLRDNSGKTALVRSLAQNWHDYYGWGNEIALKYKDNFSATFYYEIPKILLSNGAQVGIKDKSGKDALAHAAADEEKMDLFARAIDDSNKFLRQKIVVMSR
jgi:hypothetical protein